MYSRSSEAEVPVAPDSLSEVLQDLQLGPVSSGYGELAHPWGIAFARQEIARLHFLVSGRCWLASPEGEWIELAPGDAILLPHGAGHALSSSRKGVTRPYEEVHCEYIGRNTYRMCEAGGGEASLLFCCGVTFSNPGLKPLLELMPSVLLLRSIAERDPVLPLLLDTMASEVRAERMGGATMLSRLADVVIARVIRAWAEEHRDDTKGWLAAVHDPKIGRAIAAIHRNPGSDWSLEKLAGVACVSRSVFAGRFAQLVGISPARYVTRLRMEIACDWLRSDRATVAQVAERLGYDSETSFSRAFKRHIGIAPSQARRDGPSPTDMHYADAA
jgi:AraC-like DNA-binding protein